MDKQIEQELRTKLTDLWGEHLDPEQLETSIVNFIRLVSIVDDKPDEMMEKYREGARISLPEFRNKAAEEGVELTPDEMAFIFDAYQSAIQTWLKTQHWR